MFKRPVIGTFRIVREATCGKLPAAQMIAQTVATDPFARTRLITAVTKAEMLFLFTFHGKPPYFLFLKIVKNRFEIKRL